MQTRSILISSKIHIRKQLYQLLGLVMIILSCSSQVDAQDPVFSQYFNAPLTMNPAIAGISDEANVFLNYRNQWSGLPNAYRTYAISYDQFFQQANSGVGAMILSDNAGDGILTTTKIAGFYSYRVQLNKRHYFKGGFEVGVIQTSLDWNKLIFFDQLDAEFGPISPGGTPIPTTEDIPEANNQMNIDVGLGMMYYNEYFYAGASLKHINTPDQSFLESNANLYSGLPMRLSIQAGSEILLFEGFRGRLPVYLSPSVAYIDQGPFRQVHAGTFINLGAFGVGGWYRTNSINADAVIAAVSFRTGRLKVTYSFDYTVSDLELNGGTHEIGIGINFDDGITESVYNDCFNIFR